MNNNELNLRIGIEHAICRKLVNELIAQGYHLIVDGEDEELEDLETSQDEAVITAGHGGLFNFDVANLLVYKKPKKAGSERRADHFVRLVFGNDGWDVISDYSPSLEKKMRGALALSEACEDIPSATFEKAISLGAKAEGK